MKIAIYGKEHCGACVQAEVLCKSNSVVFEKLMLDKDYDMVDLFEKVGQNIRSVPQIFIEVDGTTMYLGGLKDLQEHFETV